MSTTTATPAHNGETNLDLTDDDLTRIGTQLAAINNQVDALTADRNRLAALVTAANERATAKGATTATTTALDAASAVVTQLGQHLGGVSDTTVEAADQTAAAQAGLKPARDAEDGLHAAGATGQILAPASD